MNCKNIQKLIITDYIDNELDAKSQQNIEQHLSVCKACREFAETVRDTVKQPFEHEQYIQPPRSLWHAISERIVPEQVYEESLLTNIQHNLVHRLFTRRMTLAMVTALFALVITVGIFQRSANRKAMLEAYFTEQAAHYSYLQNANGDYNGYRVNFGTALEEYFL